jgi:hypothetical protein
MHNSGGNLASKMQSLFLRPSNHTPNKIQQTRIKRGLPIMQEELPIITWLMALPIHTPGYETKRHTTLKLSTV